MSQSDFIFSYYKNNPGREIPHSEVVDWATIEFEKKFGLKIRDPDRAIRKLSQSGFLIMIKKGVYKYDPEIQIIRELEDFSDSDKKMILKRDGYKCARCKQPQSPTCNLHVDHNVPKDLGGKAIVENGQALCPSCNFEKKNKNPIEFTKISFTRYREYLVTIGDSKNVKFFDAIFKVYADFGK